MVLLGIQDLRDQLVQQDCQVILVQQVHSAVLGPWAQLALQASRDYLVQRDYRVQSALLDLQGHRAIEVYQEVQDQRVQREYQDL